MNTVCKEHEWVGYLNAKGNYCNKCGIKQPPIDYSKLPPIDFKVNDNLEVINKQECEHEWEEITESEYLTITLEVCKKCHANKFPTAFKRSAKDFKIPENLSVINKQGWEDIENAFSKFTKRMLNPPFEEYKRWLKENYLSPEKK